MVALLGTKLGLKFTFLSFLSTLLGLPSKVLASSRSLPRSTANWSMPGSRSGPTRTSLANGVTEYAKLDESTHSIQDQPALVEEGIEGRQFYMSILGTEPADVLPVMELDLSKAPAGSPRIYGHEAKSVITSPQYAAVNAVIATELATGTRARITIVAKEAAIALKVRDYARVDIRLAVDGVPMVEMNANPYLERTSAFALAALQSGLGYASLINRIVEVAWKRSEMTPFLKELQKTRAERARHRKQIARALHNVDSAQDKNTAGPDASPPPGG
jgi:D-alanine-D-alanine ligase